MDQKVQENVENILSHDEVTAKINEIAAEGYTIDPDITTAIHNDVMQATLDFLEGLYNEECKLVIQEVPKTDEEGNWDGKTYRQFTCRQLTQKGIMLRQLITYYQNAQIQAYKEGRLITTAELQQRMQNRMANAQAQPQQPAPAAKSATTLKVKPKAGE